MEQRKEHYRSRLLMSVLLAIALLGCSSSFCNSLQAEVNLNIQELQETHQVYDHIRGQLHDETPYYPSVLVALQRHELRDANVQYARAATLTGQAQQMARGSCRGNYGQVLVDLQQADNYREAAELILKEVDVSVDAMTEARSGYKEAIADAESQAVKSELYIDETSKDPRFSKDRSLFYASDLQGKAADTIAQVKKRTQADGDHVDFIRAYEGANKSLQLSRWANESVDQQIVAYNEFTAKSQELPGKVKKAADTIQVAQSSLGSLASYHNQKVIDELANSIASSQDDLSASGTLLSQALTNGSIENQNYQAARDDVTNASNKVDSVTARAEFVISEVQRLESLRQGWAAKVKEMNELIEYSDREITRHQVTVFPHNDFDFYCVDRFTSAQQKAEAGLYDEAYQLLLDAESSARAAIQRANGEEAQKEREEEAEAQATKTAVYKAQEFHPELFP